MTANAIHGADKGELAGFIPNELKASFFRAVVVANERAVGLFNSEHMEKANGGVNLKLSRVMRSPVIRDASRAKLQEVLRVSDGVEWDFV